MVHRLLLFCTAFLLAVSQATAFEAELLGKRTLKQAKHNLVIPAISVTHSHTKVFKTPHSPASEGDQGLSAVDVAMATCAAPAYFPSVQIGGELYADGGLFAVAPDQVALHEALCVL